MGAKLLWNLLASKPSWSSLVLKAKYFKGSRLSCLEEGHVIQNGSSIHKVCIKVLPQLLADLYWVPGNGKLINVWQDNVLGKTPPHLPRLQQRMEAQGQKTLWDLSTWETAVPQR